MLEGVAQHATLGQVLWSDPFNAGKRHLIQLHSRNRVPFRIDPAANNNLRLGQKLAEPVGRLAIGPC